MSAYAETYSQTYTVADVGKVIDCFAADLDMVAQATGLWSRDDARTAADDIKLMAQNDYLKEVNICLLDANGTPLRASKYEVSTDGSLLMAQRPGNNMWPRIAGAKLTVVVVQTRAWSASFAAKLSSGWGDCEMDTTFPYLTRQVDRNYVSNGYGLRKSVYV